MILDELTRSDAPLTFEELTAGCRHVAEVVVHFLACLELYKLDHVDLDQPGNFGTLTVAWTPDRTELTAGAFDLDAYEGMRAGQGEPDETDDLEDLVDLDDLVDLEGVDEDGDGDLTAVRGACEVEG